MRANAAVLTICWMALTALARPARAGAVLLLLPNDGVVSGQPGDVVGWGFDMTAGANWVLIDSVAISGETSPVSGTGPGFISYMDQLAGGNGDGATAPGQEWPLAFAQGSPGTGVGEYTVDPGTPVGTSDSGTFVITYDEYTSDPFSCSGCFVDTQVMTLPGGGPVSFTINVTGPSSTPEPGSGILAAAALGLFAWRARRLRGSSARPRRVLY